MEGDFEDTDTSAGKTAAEQSASFRVGPHRQKLSGPLSLYGVLSFPRDGTFGKKP
jgi:hypothetical protein